MRFDPFDFSTAYEKAPMESRVRCTDSVARTAESMGWSWAYWQFDSDFNLVSQELGKFYLGWTATGEWLRYTVNIEQQGAYEIGAMHTSRYDGSILIECDGKPISGPLLLNLTANAADERRNWHHWDYHKHASPVVLPAGRHVLTIRILNPGNLNLDSLLFEPTK